MGFFSKFSNRPNRAQSEEFNMRACRLADAGNFEEAAFCFDKAVELDPSNVGAWFNKANTFLVLGKNEIAMNCADQAIDLEPKHAGAWYVKACAEDNLNYYDKAANSYEKFLSNIRSTPYGSHYQSLGNAECLNFAQSRLKKMKVEMMVDEAVKLSEANDCKGALSLLQEAIDIGFGDKRDAFLYVLKGTNHIILGEIDEANESAMRAGEIDPESKEVKQFENRCRNAACLNKNEDETPLDLDRKKPSNTKGAHSRPTEVLQGHEGVVWSLIISDDGQNLTSINRNRTIYLWDLEERKNVKTMEWQGKSMFFGGLSGGLNFDNGMVFSLALSKDNERLAGGYFDGQIRVWEVNESKELSILEGHADTISSLLIAPDGDRLLSGSKDGTIRLWDLVDFKEIALRNPQTNVVLSFAMSGSGTMASGGYDGSVRLWDFESGELRKLIQVSNNPVWSLTFDSTSEFLICGNDNKTISIWNVPDGENIAVLESTEDWITSLALSPDRNILVNGDNQGGITLWDVEDLF